MSTGDAPRPPRRGRGLLALLLVLVLVVVGAAAGAVVGSSRDDGYEGTSTLQAQSPAGIDSEISALLSATTPATSEGLARSAAGLVDRADVVAAARSILGRDASGSDVRGRVAGSGVLVEVTARDPDRARAAATAAAYATALRRTLLSTTRSAYARTARSLAGRAAGSPETRRQVAVLETLAGRVVPLQIVRVGGSRALDPSPSTVVLGIIGGAAGLLLALVLLGGVALVRRPARTAATGGPVAAPAEDRGAAPPRSRDGRGVVLSREAADAASRLPLRRSTVNEFRDLGRRVRDLAGRDPGLVVVAAPPAGPSATGPALGLALAAASEGRRVALVEANVPEGAGLASATGLRSTPGLAEYLGGTVGPAETLQPIGLELALDEPQEFARTPVLIAGGGSAGDGGRDDARLASMLDGVRRGYDLTVVSLVVDDDSGPFVSGADALVVWTGRDRPSDPVVDEALQTLRAGSAAPTLVVGAARGSK